MPRVTHVKKARKDNRVCKKGESYFWWKHAFGSKQFSLTRPKPSQLTQSDKLSQLYEAQEALDVLQCHEEPDELASQINEIASTVEAVKDEYQESYDNMEQAFPNSCPVMDDIQEKIDECESWQSSLEDSASETESLDRDDYTTANDEDDDEQQEADTDAGDEEFETAKQDIIDQLETCPI